MIRRSFLRRLGTLRVSTKPIAKRGKYAWRAKRPAGEGTCHYCGRWGARTWDHIVPRSIASLVWRDDPRNLIEVCAPCNLGRERGQKPPWVYLPLDSRSFVLEKIGAYRAARYFQDVPEVA